MKDEYYPAYRKLTSSYKGHGIRLGRPTKSKTNELRKRRQELVRKINSVSRSLGVTLRPDAVHFLTVVLDQVFLLPTVQAKQADQLRYLEENLESDLRVIISGAGPARERYASMRSLRASEKTSPSSTELRSSQELSSHAVLASFAEHYDALKLAAGWIR